MRSGERGFALVLVLIFSAVGALMLVPALKLSYTTLNIKQQRTAVLQDQYARDGGAEHAMWKLQYGGGTAELTEASQTIDYTLVLNGISTDVTIQLRAEPGLSGQALADADFKVQPEASVVPLNPSPNTPTTFTYTITMQQLDPDPATGDVVEVWDQLPPGFTYVSGSTEYPPGTSWDDPTVQTDVPTSVQTLKWESFSPLITFSTYGETKSMTFQAQGTPLNNSRYCNEVAFDPNKERSGKTAIITLGTPALSGCAGWKVPMSLNASPKIVPPNVTTTVTFTATYTNKDIGDHGIDEVKVVLAPGFAYDTDSASDFPSNMTTDEPGLAFIDGRWELSWTTFPVKPVPFVADQIRTQAFKATTTPSASGSAYAEVFTKLNAPCAHAPCTIPGDDATGYSWQAGVTIVPAYDVRSEAETTSGWGNAIPGGGVSLESWNVENQ